MSLVRAHHLSGDEIESIREKAPFRINAKIKRADQVQHPEENEKILFLYNLYETEQIRANRWREKTNKNQQQMIRIFVELLGGDCDIKRINLAIRKSLKRLLSFQTGS